jgi:hypothetical protein
MHHMVDLSLVNRMKPSNLKRQLARQNQYTDSPSLESNGCWRLEKWYGKFEGYRGSNGGVMKVPRPYLLSNDLLLNLELPR